MRETGAHDETGSGRTNSSEGERGRAYGATGNGASPMASDNRFAYKRVRRAPFYASSRLPPPSSSARSIAGATKYQRRSRRTVAHDRHRPRRARLLRTPIRLSSATRLARTRHSVVARAPISTAAGRRHPYHLPDPSPSSRLTALPAVPIVLSRQRADTPTVAY